MKVPDKITAEKLGHVIYCDYIADMNKHINSFASLIITRGDSASSRSLRDSQSQTETLTDVSALVPVGQTDCEKCQFHEASRYDEKLGLLCRRCQEWFGENRIYIPIECRLDYPDVFEDREKPKE